MISEQHSMEKELAEMRVMMAEKLLEIQR